MTKLQESKGRFSIKIPKAIVKKNKWRKGTNLFVGEIIYKATKTGENLYITRIKRERKHKHQGERK